MSDGGEWRDRLPNGVDLAGALRAADGEIGRPDREKMYEFLSAAPAVTVRGLVNPLVIRSINSDAKEGVGHAAAAMAASAAADRENVENLINFVQANTSRDRADNLRQTPAVQEVIAEALARDVSFLDQQEATIWQMVAAPLGYYAAHGKNPPDDRIILAALANADRLLDRDSRFSVNGAMTRGLTYYAIFRPAPVAEGATQTLRRIMEKQNEQSVESMGEIREISRTPEWTLAKSHDLKGISGLRQQNMLKLLELLYGFRGALGSSCVVFAAQAFTYEWAADLSDNALRFMQRIVIAEAKTEQTGGRANMGTVHAIAAHAIERTDDAAAAGLRAQIAEYFPSLRNRVDPGRALRGITARLIAMNGQGG